MTIPSYPVPSLASLAFQKLCTITEKDSIRYYQGRQICSISQRRLSKSLVSLDRIKSFFFTPEESPASIIAQRVSTGILMNHHHRLSYRILCEVERLSPKASTEEAWKKLLQKRWPKLTPPQLVSAKSSYIIQDFLEAYLFCGDDFRRIAKDRIALFVENADTLDGIELLSSHPELCDELLLSLVGFMPNMKTLIYKGVCKISSRGIWSTVAQAPLLENISFGSTIVSRQVIRQMTQSCQKLKLLELPILNDDVSLEDLFHLIKVNPNLETLILSGDQGMRNEDLIKLISMLPSLKNLELRRSPHINGHIFDMIFRERCLEKLSFSFCPQICDETISDTTEHYSLNELRVTECFVSEMGFQRLKGKFPYIKLIHIH